MAQMLDPPSPCLCQASLKENYTLLIEASLSLITVLQANNTSYLSLHSPKKLYLPQRIHFTLGTVTRKISLKYFSQNFTVLNEISQRLNIAHYLQPDSVAPLRTFQKFLPNLIFSYFYSSPQTFCTSCSEFCVLLSLVCFALDLRMLLCSFRVIISYQPFQVNFPTIS